MFSSKALALGLALALPSCAWAQVPQTGAGRGNSKPAYIGPGNIVGSPTGWWGLRAFSASSIGNNALILCTAADASCETETIGINGALSLGAVGLTCNNTTTICTVKQLYDQISTNHLVQATIATRPTFKINCIGALPCMQFVLASGQCLVNTTFPTVNQPFTISWVAQRNGGLTTQQGILTSHASGTKPADYFTTSANQIWMFDGTVRAVTAADNTWHTEQSVYNNATTPGAILDGTATTLAGSPGSTNWTTAHVAIGCDSNGIANVTPLTGLVVEGGVWPVAFTAQQGADMNTNQKTYWGF